MTVDFATVELSPVPGIISGMTRGCDQVVVTMKKVMSKKPKSTMGVRSTLVDNFLERSDPDLGFTNELFISAINNPLKLDADMIEIHTP
jgi:hypothetical protein